MLEIKVIVWLPLAASIAFVGTLFCPDSANAQSLHWRNLPRLPVDIAFTAPFAGTHNGALIVAGGANCPDRRPWESTTKIWYDAAFVLEAADGQWKTGFRLPRPLGHGVSITTTDGVAVIGGNNSGGQSANCFMLRWQQGDL